MVTPGMKITVSGEHWYPQDNFTIKYCAAQLGENGWEDGPDCGKEVNPALGMVSIDADGRMRQQFTIPASEKPGVIMVYIREVIADIGVQPIAVHVVDHLPGWDDIHPRVAAIRNTLVGSLPFTSPAYCCWGRWQSWACAVYAPGGRDIAGDETSRPVESSVAERTRSDLASLATHRSARTYSSLSMIVKLNWCQNWCQTEPKRTPRPENS